MVNRVLVGEAKLSSDPDRSREYMRALWRKATVCPCLKGKDLVFKLWVMEHRGDPPEYVVNAQTVLAGMRKGEMLSLNRQR